MNILNKHAAAAAVHCIRVRRQYSLGGSYDRDSRIAHVAKSRLSVYIEIYDSSRCTNAGIYISISLYAKLRVQTKKKWINIIHDPSISIRNWQRLACSAEVFISFLSGCSGGISERSAIYRKQWTCTIARVNCISIIPGWERERVVQMRLLSLSVITRYNYTRLLPRYSIRLWGTRYTLTLSLSRRAIIEAKLYSPSLLRLRIGWKSRVTVIAPHPVHHTYMKTNQNEK